MLGAGRLSLPDVALIIGNSSYDKVARLGNPANDAALVSETLKAAGMAAATMANNALALLFTVLFARLLGAEDYGSLAALVSTFVILMVPGSAVQVAVAREIAIGRLGSGPQVAATLAIWRRRLLIAGAAVTAVAVLLREPIADLISVSEEWAAAAWWPRRATRRGSSACARR